VWFTVRTRDTVAAALGKTVSQVKVVPMPVGGGFGGKFGLIEPLVAACAVASERPVRLQYTRIEDFSAARPAPSSMFRVKAGVRADGTFTARCAAKSCSMLAPSQVHPPRTLACAWRCSIDGPIC
jgi:CO/xanthine dehydrogenase Mo-binding subunit